MQQGNLDYNIPVTTNDEMGYLADTLNYMSGELSKSGEYQHKFVANVSHDFRSPLLQSRVLWKRSWTERFHLRCRIVI